MGRICSPSQTLVALFRLIQSSWTPAPGLFQICSLKAFFALFVSEIQLVSRASLDSFEMGMQMTGFQVHQASGLRFCE
eukprot:JP438271.1.p2 GENE.JP438271.1~~JP438271.1.p2  ORF type:complete len:78 (+),score=1.41 JP438271.1:216-449(+)